jgi:hypothetical protein
LAAGGFLQDHKLTAFTYALSPGAALRLHGAAAPGHALVRALRLGLHGRGVAGPRGGGAAGAGAGGGLKGRLPHGRMNSRQRTHEVPPAGTPGGVHGESPPRDAAPGRTALGGGPADEQ